MTCNLLGSVCEGLFTVVVEKLDCCAVRAADFELAAVKTGTDKVIKPLAGVHRVDDFYTLDNITENFFSSCRSHSQTHPSQYDLNNKILKTTKSNYIHIHFRKRTN